MFQPSTGLLSSLFSPRRSSKRLSRRAKVQRRRYSAIEELEARRLLVSRVFLDFGDSFGVQTQPTDPYFGQALMPSLDPNDFHDNLVGTGLANRNILQESFGVIRDNLTVTPKYNLLALYTLINSNLNPTLVPTDALTLELAITAQIQQALEPFDIEVVSSAQSNFFNFPAPRPITPDTSDLTNAARLLALNNLPGDGGSPVNGTARVPQYGSDDVYVFFGGLFQTFTIGNVTVAVGSNIPISAEFAVMAGPTAGVNRPDRLDTGAVIDVNYWINRVLGAGGTGGSLNVALSNAALYAIGFGFGVSEVANGMGGPYTSYFDPNTALINQSNVMQEGGFGELVLGPPFDTPIKDTNAAYFQRFSMMQNGADMQQYLRFGTLFDPVLLGGAAFPLPTTPTTPYPQFAVTLSQPGAGTIFYYVTPDSTVNTDPTMTVNSYDQLANDPDIGANPDVAYVTGTGAFDQITISKVNATQARVTVNAFTDSSYTTLATDELGVIASYSYLINLTKIVIPGRKDSGKPFRIVVQGATNDDQIFIDPTLGVNVTVHGGPDVKFVQFTGNGAYNAVFTPVAPPAFNTPNLVAIRLIYEGLLAPSAGTLKITGSTTAIVNKKSVVTPFTTTVSFDHFNPANDSAIRLDTFNKLTVTSPGFLNNDIMITSPSAGFWSIGGQVNSPFFTPALFGALQITNVSQLEINTTLGASNDTVTFANGAALPTGLQGVTIAMGTGIDTLNFDDSSVATDMNYSIGPTLVQYIPVVGPLFQGFLGFTYSGVEAISVTGTQGNNLFVVTPSLTTGYFIDGQDPPPGTLPPDGDTLAVRLTGTVGAFNFPSGPGDGTITFTSAHKPIGYTNIELFDPPPDATIPPISILAVAASTGTNGKPLIRVYDATTHLFLYQFYAYEVTYKGGVQVTTADMNGDGTPDIITAPNAGRVAEVRIFDGTTGAFLNSYQPNGAGYKLGLYLAAGDVDGDGQPEIITSLQRGLSQVQVAAVDTSINITPGILTFQPYDKKVVSGAVVAAADIDADGRADIITAPGAGNIATVKVFDGQTAALLHQFNAFENTFKGGVSLAAGDVDADGRAEVILGAGTGGRSRVRVFDANFGILLKEFQAYTTGNINAPVRVAVHESIFDNSPVNNGTRTDTGVHAVTVYTGQGLAGSSHDIRAFEPLSGAQVDHFLETSIDMVGGVYVG